MVEETSKVLSARVLSQGDVDGPLPGSGNGSSPLAALLHDPGKELDQLVEELSRAGEQQAWAAKVGEDINLFLDEDRTSHRDMVARHRQTLASHLKLQTRDGRMAMNLSELSPQDVPGHSCVSYRLALALILFESEEGRLPLRGIRQRFEAKWPLTDSEGKKGKTRRYDSIRTSLSRYLLFRIDGKKRGKDSSWSLDFSQDPLAMRARTKHGAELAPPSETTKNRNSVNAVASVDLPTDNNVARDGDPGASEAANHYHLLQLLNQTRPNHHEAERTEAPNELDIETSAGLSGLPPIAATELFDLGGHGELDDEENRNDIYMPGSLATRSVVDGAFSEYINWPA